MTHCGATGSALDQVSRSLLGENSEASKQVSSLLGHVVTTNGGASMQRPMPMSAPEQLSMLMAHERSVVTPPIDANWQPQHYHQQAVLQQEGAINVLSSRHLPHSQYQAMMHHQQHINHQMASMQMHIMHQQQMMMMQERMQQENRVVVEEEARQGQEWHDGLEAHAKHELQRNVEELDDQEVGHDGFVEGASIEDLMAAWAEAEADYEEEPTTNLWSGYETPTYDFLHRDFPENVDQINWMEEGMHQFELGNIAEAIRAFELELQFANQDNAAAWRMLGRCHAENDQDREAIACLEQAVERDPFSPEAHLALCVSYVNELNHKKALESLRAWIKNNPKYAGIEHELHDDPYGSSVTIEVEPDNAFEEAQRLLTIALEYDPTDAADVWEALGVMYNVSRDYKDAATSFEQALQVRPDDYQLLNKLGATLANSSQSEKALPLYGRALELRPRYARAWLNMAISHSNLNQYDEAARCYLQTISLNPAATHCWSYLRIALSCAERWDLLPLAASQDLNAFKQHFDFAMYESSANK